MSIAKQLVNTIIPSQYKSVIKQLIPMPIAIFRIHRIWKRNDLFLQLDAKNKGIGKYEDSLYSQNGEDGILRFLFSEIGFQSKTFLEFGFAVTENNSLRLVLKEGFGGIFIDGSDLTVKYFNKASKSLGLSNVRAIKKFLKLENLENTIISSGLRQDIDLLSIDVDGNDYWFWEDINYLNPRIVVIEYNSSFGPDLAITIPYDPCFDRHEKHPSGFYCGASLLALEKLGKRKGYSLIGCDSNGINAFFIRDDCLTNNIKQQSTYSAYMPHKLRMKRGFSSEDQFNIIKDLPYVTIN